MAKPKFDGVVEAVHYKPDGQVDWVRTFLRRGPTFSDYIILDRQTLVEHLKSGKKYMAGRRIPQLASTFEVTTPLRVIQNAGRDVLVTGDIQSDQDKLADVPVI
jgi:hypothetical protein